MKKLLILMLALIIAFAFTACGDSSSNGGEKESGGPTDSTGDSIDGNGGIDTPQTDAPDNTVDEPDDDDTVLGGEPSEAVMEFFALIASGNWRMEMFVEQIGDTAVVSMYDGMTAMETDTGNIGLDEMGLEGKVSVIIRDDMTYVIFQDMGMYMIMDSDYMGDLTVPDFSNVVSAPYIGSGMTEFNGDMVNYDAFVTEGGSEYFMYVGDKVVGLMSLDEDDDKVAETAVIDYGAVTADQAFDIFDVDAIEENYALLDLMELLGMGGDSDYDYGDLDLGDFDLDDFDLESWLEGLNVDIDGIDG